MTSTALTSKFKKPNFKTPFWVNYFTRISSLKRILIVMSVLHLLGLPLLLASYIYSEVSNKYGMAGFIPISICCLAGALLCGFIIALNSFDYLYKKSNVDMMYSLPLTNSQHFLSDYFAGLTVYLVPYILSVIFSFIINGFSLMVFTDWNSLDTLEGITLILLKLSICGLILMIMFYTLTVLITTCCGSMFEAITYNIIANGLIPGVIAVFILIFFNDIYGIDKESYLFDYISYSSPLGSLIGLCNIDAVCYNSVSVSPLIRWYILNLAFDIIYFFVAMFLYGKRKAEDVSKPFVFKTFYYVVMTCITFIIVAVAIESDDFETFAPMIFLSAIVYFIFEVITNRGFKKFGLSVVRYFGTVLGVVIFTLIADATNGFGVENRVPVVDSVRSVKVNYGGLYETDRYGDYNNDVTFTDRDTIKLVTEFHKDVINNRFNSYHYNTDSYDNYENYRNYIQTVNITYTTHLGREISRTYEVSFEQFMMLKDLSVHPSYIKQTIKDFSDYLLINYEHSTYSEYYTGSNDSLITLKNRKYYLYVSSKLDVNPKTYENLSYSDIMKLIEVYQMDLENRTLEDIMQPQDTYCKIGNYAIFSSYTNTINFLTEHKYLPPSIETELSSYSFYNDSSNTIMLYSPSDITCMGGGYSTSINQGYKINGNGGVALYSTDKQLLELLKVAQPYYITTDECYILSFNGELYVIPSKYSNVAEECYKIDRFNTTSHYSSVSTYGELSSIWQKYSEYVEDYPVFELFLNDLLKGNLDINTATDTNDYSTLKNYFNQYWDTYYDGNVQSAWNEQYINQYPNYDDYVWYIIENALDITIKN